MNHRVLRVVGVLSLVTAGLLAAGAGVAWHRYQAFLDAPLDIPRDGLVLRVQPGDPVLGVVDRLDRLGTTRNDWRWRLLLNRHPVTIQTGEYAIPAGATPASLLDLLERGDVIQYRFTIVEGWNWRQLRTALLADERLAVPAERLADDVVMQAVGGGAEHPEGWFLPETYAFTADDDALDVLARAHDAMQAALDAAWNDRRDDLPLDSPYELLTLASIIEKESSVAAERPEIAGVFVRRLQQNWRLETDPTVIYGLGERYDGDIRSRDLREDTPWNTYVHRGLPPTPIAMPGVPSLEAAARPADGTTMFFVADGKGGHVFSETLEEHNRAVRELVRRQRALGAGDGAAGEEATVPDGDSRDGGAS